MSSRDATYIDGNGYERYSNSGRLVHREVAYERLYRPHRGFHRLPFGSYQVHHRDGNKRNNSPGNLELVTREEHERKHWIPFWRGIISAIKAVALLGAALILAATVAGALVLASESEAGFLGRVRGEIIALLAVAAVFGMLSLGFSAFAFFAYGVARRMTR